MARGKARRSLELIEASIEILREIQPATVRAICYRLFTRGLIDSMAKIETNRVGRQLTDARERGWIPWAWIVDEARGVEVVSSWADPSKFADTVTRAYRRNKWAAQRVRVEVWSEKGTVRGTLAPILDQYEVPFRVMHGFASATVVHDVARASLACAERGQRFLALYVGDFDPSGLYMSERDLPDRLRAYRFDLEARAGVHSQRKDGADEETDDGLDEFAAHQCAVTRIALTEADSAALGRDVAFPLASKRGDPRHAWYLEEQALDTDGRTTTQESRACCWELDALSPVVLRERVEAAIVAQLDRAIWDRYVHAETVERESIVATVGAWRALTVAEAGA